jgi:hypothetical protein
MGNFQWVKTSIVGFEFNSVTTVSQEENLLGAHVSISSDLYNILADRIEDGKCNSLFFNVLEIFSRPFAVFGVMTYLGSQRIVSLMAVVLANSSLVMKAR